MDMDMVIREERPEDWHDTEVMTKRAFWNHYCPGCDEHYLVHKMRDDKDFLPQYSRVAEVNGRVAGAIYYARSWVDTGARRVEVLIFGPLCVEPEFQNMGIGGSLIRETLELARKSGERGVIIYGSPDYYPRYGFRPCKQYGITTRDGENFDAFMGLELVEGGLSDIPGTFHDAQVYYNLPANEVEEYDKNFPWMEKKKLPGQLK